MSILCSQWKMNRRVLLTVSALFVVSVISILMLSLSSDKTQPALVGSDRDEHGCIPSAGYTWCEKTQQCERWWELTDKLKLDKTPEAFSEFCSSK